MSHPSDRADRPQIQLTSLKDGEISKWFKDVSPVDRLQCACNRHNFPMQGLRSVQSSLFM